ncbi:hypothetical protein LOTGIDRAFT_143520 [Lottia gigantea]|uniref:Basal body-orientation factor 1 n=1 Tax=Lottia gigantea TaxID=225164 RepID=V4C633_LOTGI|nr:hypothetical protein LOTGIDRAFT_143520 [Lottia gigantea]ESO97084.1 hypothetical protein LOTGIDRAFT_143520 [Lottia gigantea]
MLAFSAANSRLWETRLVATEASKNEYKTSAQRLANQNEDLNSLLVKNERDTIDVIKYQKNKMSDLEKELQGEKEKERSLKKTHRQETEKIIQDFTKQICHLDEKLKAKNQEVNLLKDELKFAREFRKNRREMLSEIAELKKTLEISNKSHQLEFSNLEKKFLTEKCRLEKETKSKMMEITEKTQKEAISNLDEATKLVFKDNVRLKEVLAMEISENERLLKSNDFLTQENKELFEELSTKNMTLNKQMVQAKMEHEKLATTKGKVGVLENSLTHIIREFDEEKNKMVATSGSEVLSIKEELERLQRVLELKTREMAKIKKLAKTILEQRTEVEGFFMDALDHVRLEIANTKSNWKSRGCVSMSALEETETINNLRRVKGQVDISDLTWLQKERVLRLLFAKMNGYSRYTTIKLPTSTKDQPVEVSSQVEVTESSFLDMKTFLSDS